MQKFGEGFSFGAGLICAAVVAVLVLIGIEQLSEPPKGGGW